MYILYIYIYMCIILSMRCLFCQLNLCDSFHRFVCSNYWVFYWLNTRCLILLACLILHLLHLNRQSIYLPLSLSLSPSRHPSFFSSLSLAFACLESCAIFKIFLLFSSYLAPFLPPSSCGHFD